MSRINSARGALRLAPALVVALGAYAACLPTLTQAGHAPKSAKPLGQVRYVYHGLTVMPPKSKSKAGKVKMSLYTSYLLRTGKAQRASMSFQDGTFLHMNQKTDAVLRNPHLTYVKNGEVDEILSPGTNHQVQTASAVASAIGTNFLIKSVRKGKGSYLIVVHGSALFKNSKGSQVVQTNQESLVLSGQAPQPPQPVNAQQAAGWAGGMPNPNLPENVALSVSGAKVVSFSSQYKSSVEGNFWAATYVNDGRLDYGWASASGQTTNQWVKLALAGGKTYSISEIVLDCAATHGDPISSDMKNFEILVSTSGTDDASFTRVLKKTCQQNTTLQHFALPSPTRAKYVELIALDNYGSPDWVTVAELEVVGRPA